MALCDQGYLCEVCGKDVADLTESDLYLRYVLGEVDPETLHVQPERHLVCNPTLSQFIEDDRFPGVRVEGYFARSELDAEFVALEVERVTAGYRRLHDLRSLGLPIAEYPLPEQCARWQGQGAGSLMESGNAEGCSAGPLGPSLRVTQD